MDFQKHYWQLFNFLGRRVLAVGFIVVGFVIGLMNSPRLMPGGTIDVNGVPSADFGDRLIAVVFPLLVGVLGIALYRVKPFTPNWLDKTK